MDLDPVILSGIQFAFVISFHIIFPAFTIGLAAWLATIEGMRLVTGNPIYRRIFDFWLKVFAVSFGMGVVTGIVMAFQFGTNWGVLAERTGPIQGPLLGIRGVHRVHARGELLRRHAARPRPGFAALLFLRLLHGVDRNDVLLVLDFRQQLLDAGPGRPRNRRRQDHPRGLARDRARASDDGALAAHAAGRLPDHRDVRRGVGRAGMRCAGFTARRRG